MNNQLPLSQLAITFLKLTTETLEQGVIRSKLTIKIPKRRQWCRSGIFIVNFEHISHLVLDFLLLTLNMLLPNGLILEVKFDGNPSLNFEGDEF